MTYYNKDDIFRLALATTKTGGNALPIENDNTSTGAWVSIADAVDSGTAFAVNIKRSLVALDLDTPELIEIGEVIRESVSLPTLLVGSGRNQHMYIHAGTHSAAVVDRVRELGIPASAVRQTIRPPLSPHRLGLPVRLVAPSTVDEALQALGPIDEPKHLPDWIVDLIDHGDRTNRFEGNRSNMALTIASAMKRADLTLAHFRAVMTNRDNLGATKAHELEDQGKDVDIWIVRTWDRAEMSGFEREGTERVRAGVLAAGWPGQAGTTDKGVMLALCDLAISHGTSTPTFGVRRIAEVAQLGSDKTVRRSLERLSEAGWIRRVPASSKGLADGYKLLEMVNLTALDNGGDGNRCGQLAHSTASTLEHLRNHPVFRNRSGLGKSRGSVWVALAGIGPATKKQLAEAATCSVSTVGRALPILAEHGLAEQTQDGWVALGDESDLDTVAVTIGAMERAFRQMEEHERHRQGFKMMQKLQQRQADLPEVTDTVDDQRRQQEEMALMEQI
ncbi:helix-turn-helix domain-containing protein [Rhodococcus opacus]|uniref:helix-turn-helix domain-containing protein n=1 Tax=Rhodococcus opacus TaxID=37919 RepID=UPI0022364F64|nr:helix-turn-helix domain-containing protein [Rhodococcus opacus]UZG56244.1 helix-turn-helix domain-containing protein [Rhodococcus opacus]